MLHVPPCDTKLMICVGPPPFLNLIELFMKDPSLCPASICTALPAKFTPLPRDEHLGQLIYHDSKSSLAKVSSLSASRVSVIVEECEARRCIVRNKRLPPHVHAFVSLYMIWGVRGSP